MQQDAGSRLGWGAQLTMRVAQRLYENGYITYMRTDSVTLSQSMQEASNALPAPPSEGMLAVEVIEGDDESAWAAWEESVHFQESQLQTVQGSATASGSSPGEVSTEHVDIF